MSESKQVGVMLSPEEKAMVQDIADKLAKRLQAETDVFKRGANISIAQAIRYSVEQQYERMQEEETAAA